MARLNVGNLPHFLVCLCWIVIQSARSLLFQSALSFFFANDQLEAGPGLVDGADLHIDQIQRQC